MGLYQELGIQDTMSDAELATYLASIRREWSRRQIGSSPLEKQRIEQRLRQIDALANAEARIGDFPRPALVMKTLCAAIDHKYSDYYGLEEGLVRSCSRGVFRSEFRSILTYLSQIGEEELAQEWVQTLEELRYPFDLPKRRIQTGNAGTAAPEERDERSAGVKSRRASRGTTRRRTSQKSAGKSFATDIRLAFCAVLEIIGEFFRRLFRKVRRSLREAGRGRLSVRLVGAGVALIAALVVLVVVVRHISAVQKAEAEAKAQAEAAAAAEQEEQAKARKAQEELLAGLQGMDNFTLSVDENAVVSYQRAEPSSCTASSELVGVSGTVYGTANLFDENTQTSWQEGEEGDGIGVTITVSFAAKTNLKAIAFFNGNQISQERLEANNRLEDITITVTCEGESYAGQYTLQDTLGEQDLVFDASVPAESLTIQIDSVYSGSIYQDTVLTGLYFYSGT